MSVSQPPESATPSPPASSAAPAASEASPPLPAGVLVHAGLAAGLAWLVPGLGHVYLRRFGRGLVFFAIVITALVVGYLLQGELYHPQPGKPLSKLATLGAMGMGVPYFILRFALQYSGDLMGRGYEYGSAFLLTAGLMNWLLAFDAWDIGCGKKE